jgi:hypothetical protein
MSTRRPSTPRGKLLAVIDGIRKKVRAGALEFTVPHFIEEMVNDDLTLADIEMAIGQGRIRRRFARDPRGTRYEIVGPGTDGRQLAVICRIKTTGKVLLITTYLVE